MPRHYLLSTPPALKALRARHPRVAAHGQFGFVSTELVFADALAAHELQDLLEELYHAAARVHAKVRIVRGKRAQQDLANLAGALQRVREWV